MIGPLSPKQAGELSPESYLNAETFGPVDTTSERYQDGLLLANAAEVTVSVTGSWGAWGTLRGRRWTRTAYEILGYHSGTASFWAGVIASGVPITVYRVENDKIVKHEVRK